MGNILETSTPGRSVGSRCQTLGDFIFNRKMGKYEINTDQLGCTYPLLLGFYKPYQFHGLIGQCTAIDMHYILFEKTIEVIQQLWRKYRIRKIKMIQLFAQQNKLDPVISVLLAFF